MLKLLGNLTLSAFHFDVPAIAVAAVFTGLVAIIVLVGITYFKKWTYLWREWIISVDHKKIGIMYIILAFTMLLRGFIDAALMRSQQAIAVGHSMGYLPAEHYAEIFTAHGVLMIFFMAMPFMFGLMNLVIPLQIGTRDVAFPYLNSLSLWLTVSAAGLMMASLFIGKFAATGWLAYPPLSEMSYSPGVGVDYYIWALQITGVGSLLSGINFFVTIVKMRCPGMTLMKMPIFTWSVLCTTILIMLAFPILTATLAMLYLDRLLGTHFFTSGFGGNMMMYINLIWAWGHPEVYILILPAFGIFSEVVPTFSHKKLFGYVTMVGAIAVITVLSFVVWLHHFFTMGAGANVNAFFGITTMIIAIPTGVKIFNWLFTMYRGRITFATPMLWTIGFIVTFAVGGMTGVLMAVPGIDFQVHNSLFLVAHFHNVIIGGVVFGYFAGLIYWFPKAFGFKLNERIGKYAFWLWTVGFYTAFMPLYILGLKGMTRRLNHYDAATGWHPYLVIAAIGATIIALAVLTQVIQLIISIKNKDKLGYIDNTGDPWGGRTLEWSTSSPAPFYNFAIIPHVDSRDAYFRMKERAKKGQKQNQPEQTAYSDIHMPKDTGVGFIIAVLAAVLGFAMVWHIFWLAIISAITLFIMIIARMLNENTDYYVKKDEVEKIEKQWHRNKKELASNP